MAAVVRRSLGAGALRPMLLTLSRSSRHAPRISGASCFLASRAASPHLGAGRARFYSQDKKPQRPEDEQGKSQNQKAKGKDTKPKLPLPEGWVRLSQEDIQFLRSQLGRVGALPGDVETAFRVLEQIGAPRDMARTITELREKGPSIKHLGTLLRSIPKLAALREVQDMARKAEERDGRTPASPPETEGKQEKPEQKVDSQAKTSKSEQDGQDKGSRSDKANSEPADSKKQSEKKKTKDDDSNFSFTDKKLRLTDWGVLSLILAFLLSSWGGGGGREITWQEVRREFLEKGLIERLAVQGNVVTVELNQEALQSSGVPEQLKRSSRYYFTIGSSESFERNLDEAQGSLGIPPNQRIPVSYSQGSSLMQLVVAFGPSILLIGLLLWGSRSLGGRGGGGANPFNLGKTKAKIYSESNIKVKFADVAGMEEAKVEIMEFVSFLKHPEKFERLGAKIPRGAILSGPPGTGKTLLAKATAGESGVPFYSVSGSEFVEIFVGVGASRVRDLFRSARKNSPSIIFIDEIDAVGRSRGDGKRFGGGNDEREATLNQILTEMDGFNTSEQVVVLAGTNRADVLDKALMRPGRFDRHIYIDHPTMSGRKDIFRVHLKKILTHEDTEQLVGRLASLTPGFAGADIANVVNEAALVAARANAASVSMIHFEQAIERVIGGLEKKSLVLKPAEKRTVAYHEAGHAICGWFLEHADPLLKVSIIPRGAGALGYAQYLPQDMYLMGANQIMDRMTMTLGGRVSEELHFPTVTTGASDDFRKVSAMARRMVTEWGMSETVGPIAFGSDQQSEYGVKPFSEETAQAIDAEVKRIVQAAYKTCKDLLTDKKKEVGLVAEELLKKEVLTRDDMVRLLGRRQWGGDEEFEKYFGGGPGGSITPPNPENTDSPPPPDAAPNPPAPAFRRHGADDVAAR